jgi:hypothetical protein
MSLCRGKSVEQDELLPEQSERLVYCLVRANDLTKLDGVIRPDPVILLFPPEQCCGRPLNWRERKELNPL